MRITCLSWDPTTAFAGLGDEVSKSFLNVTLFCFVVLTSWEVFLLFSNLISLNVTHYLLLKTIKTSKCQNIK